MQPSRTNGVPAPAATSECPRATRNSRKTKYWRVRIATGWTPERRALQAQAVKQWYPGSTRLARVPLTQSRSARNADKGGGWRKLRQMVKMLNRAICEHQEALRVACMGEPAQQLTAPIMAEA
jgi:hypothetical protein